MRHFIYLPKQYNPVQPAFFSLPAGEKWWSSVSALEFQHKFIINASSISEIHCDEDAQSKGRYYVRINFKKSAGLTYQFEDYPQAKGFLKYLDWALEVK